MQIEFNAGEAGFYEASALLRIVRHARDVPPADSAAQQLLDTLTHAAQAALADPAFAHLAADSAPVVADETVAWWQGLLGPSRQERRLSEQRVAALERAERAERSSFDALAETARVGRERDDALARIATLESELAALRSNGDA